MSRRKRTSDRCLCLPETLEQARSRITEGESIRSVARSLEMHEATLRKRLKKPAPATSLGRYTTTFTKAMEAELCDYIKNIDNMFYGLTTKSLREIAYNFAEKNNLSHRFNKEEKLAGKEWLRGFLKRHPELSLRRPTSTSVARAIGFNKPQCERYFNNLSQLLLTHNFPPQSIFNMDETGISTVPNKPPKVLSTKGKRCVNKISSAERGTNVTLVNAVNAIGNFIPPAFIFARKRMKAELLDGAPPSSIGMVSDTSYINGDLFLDWLSHFRDNAKPSKENPVLLILDNHTSHCTIKAVDFFRKNHIHALTIPPHSSHKTQPLDRCIHNSLKIFYSAECEKWMRNHPGRAITTYQIASILTPAFLKAATTAKAIESFKITGICTFNPDIFRDEDFLASVVTERPMPATVEHNPTPSTSGTLNTSGNASYVEVPQSPVILNPVSDLPSPQRNYPLVQRGTISTIIISRNKYMTQTNENPALPLEANSSATPEITTKSTILTSEGSAAWFGAENTSGAPASNSSETFVSLLHVAPLPRAENLTRSTRKKGKSDILSSSPFKRQLEEDNTSKNKKTSIKPKKTFKKPKTTPKKKIWKCPGCHEVYKEPISEDWIECSKCQPWWHEECTDYINIGEYICDLCGK